MARILIVEDNSDNMKLFAALLGMDGHEVVGRPDGEGLLETLEANPPDLVLLDIQLPGRDGYSLLQEIRESPHRGVRVIALTAHAMSGDEQRALEAGFDGYMAKPINVREFPARIGQLLAEAPERNLQG